MRHLQASVVAALAAAAVICYLWLRCEWAEARAVSAEAEAAKWQASHDALRAATEEQGQAVRALVAQSNERSDRAAKALSRADALAKSFQDRADNILLTQAPSGDLCAAAQEAFAAELKLERQQ